MFSQDIPGRKIPCLAVRQNPLSEKTYCRPPPQNCVGDGKQSHCRTVQTVYIMAPLRKAAGLRSISVFLSDLFRACRGGRIFPLFAGGVYLRYNSRLPFGLAAVPLLVSTKTLSQALGDSVLGKFAVEFSGNSLTELDRERVCGRSNAAFLLGLVLGVLSYFVSPLYMLLGLAGLIGAALVFNSPEFGTVMLFFLMPLFPTEPLIILAAFRYFHSL